MADYLGVSYRLPPGPRGGKKKPQVWFKMRRTIPGAATSQMEAFWRAQDYVSRHLPLGTDVWKWES
jgi:hypothetical protein